MNRSRNLVNLLYIIPLGFLGLFFFFPLAAVVWESFAPQGRLDLSPLSSLWREPYFRGRSGSRFGSLRSRRR